MDMPNNNNKYVIPLSAREQNENNEPDQKITKFCGKKEIAKKPLPVRRSDS